MKIFVVNNDNYYIKWLLVNKKLELTKKLEDADIIMFTGGADVNPELYNAKKHYTTYCNIKRDEYEIEIFNRLQKLEKKPLCIGVCRGSQFLTIVNGGKLIQNVNNHGLWGTHPIVFNDEPEQSYEITSTHHQMMYPFDLPKENYIILAQSKEKRSTIYEGDLISEPPVEPEVVYYPKTNCLCIQGHPEMMDCDEPVINKLNNIVDKLLNNE